MNSDAPPIPEGAGGRRRLYCAVASTARPNYYVLLRGVPYCGLGVTTVSIRKKFLFRIWIPVMKTHSTLFNTVSFEMEPRITELA